MPYFVKRLASMLVGLAIESFGIALITKSNLGTSPISSIAWVVTLKYPWISFGVTTFAMNAIFVLIEVILLRRDFHAVQYLQLAVTFWFAAAITGLIVNFFNRHVRFVSPTDPSVNNASDAIPVTATR
ncbi:hypothetical protein [Bifidobacterium cebidarum]|uniref:Integral membrane protein n=1 Tax=Bifidobacterium cebidarum TaxID=2650773 RepID=A0A6I1GA24_9BIFI|nr:hypothetical protein [Bifidobacterium cebidarum]KAB7788390.1 hypothetical protein F7D08_1131 [Bifidobacterium cebidarum]